MLLDSSHKPLIAAIGDSITYGYPDGNSWTQIVQKTLGLEVINAGINGDTLQGMAIRLHKDVIAKNPDICIVLGGTNDSYLGYEISQLKENIMEIMKMLEVEGVIPVIGTPIPILYPSCEEMLVALREWVTVVCPHNIPFHKAFYEGERLLLHLIPDGVHPTEEGYRKMADIAISYLHKMIHEL